MDKYNGEEILVFNSSLLNNIGYFTGISTNTEKYIKSIFATGNNHFHNRFKAETDISLKQIIPYVIFVYKDTVFSYVRGKKAGETRLIGNRSIGIGGHINPIDSQNQNKKTDSSEDISTYTAAVKREISEEVTVEENYDPQIAALINDDSNPVGKVHFGIMHLCRLSKASVKKREQQITESGFININELATRRRRELESWSRFTIDFLVNSYLKNL
jgi:predicted NUDIX family phosphoesterase